MGNLTVYPGSHRIIESVLREIGGPEAVFNASSTVSDATPRSARGASLISASIDEQVAATNELRRLVHPRLGQPEQILARQGDVIIAHYQLAHCIACLLHLLPAFGLVIHFISGQDGLFFLLKT